MNGYELYRVQESETHDIVVYSRLEGRLFFAQGGA